MTFEPERAVEPREETPPVCPMCGAECETYFLDSWNCRAGCEVCMRPVSAREWLRERRERHE